MDPELTRELEEQIQLLNQTLSQLSGVMSDQLKAVTTTTTTIQQSNATSNTNKQANQQNSQAKNKLAEADKAATEALNNASQNFRSALLNGAQALGSFQSALFSSQEGMAKYGKAAESAGAAAADFGRNFGILGTATGGLIGIIGKIVGEVFKLTDNIVNLRDSFTKTAGVLPITTTEIGNLAKQARFSVDDMQKLSKATNSLGQNMLGLGGYAGQGAVKFMKMAAVSDDVRRQYGRLGVSQEQLLDLQTKYVKAQAVSGQAYQNQTRSAAQLQKDSLAYADNLIKMSSLTGKSAEELQAARDQAMLEYEEQVQIAAENAKIRKLREERRFQEADALQLEQDNRHALIEKYSQLYGPEQGQLAGRLMRQGSYDSKTGGLAIRDPNMLSFVENLKKSKDASGDILKYADKTEKSYDDAAQQYGKSMQYLGEEGGKLVGLTKEAITQRNLRAKSPSEAMKEITKDIDTKKQAGTDPLADNIESVKSFEREMKAKLQTFLEYIDPMRMGADKLIDIAKAAAIALGAVAAIIITPKVLRGASAVVKAVGSGIGKGLGAVTGLFKKGPSGASGIVSTVTGTGAGSSGTSTLTKITKAADVPGASKAEIFITAIVRGLEALDKVGKPLIQGSVYAGGAIVAIGGVIAALEVVAEDQLPYTAKKLQQFENIDGPKIEAIGFGMAALGTGVLAAGGGKIVKSISSIVDWFAGNEDPFTEYSKQMTKFQSYNFNTPVIENNAQSIISFAKAMAILSGKSALGSMGSASKSLADGITSYFKANPPTKEIIQFSNITIDAKQTKKNVNAFVAFSDAIGTYKGFGKPVAAISTALASAATKFFGVDPPVAQFSQFSRLNIDGKKTTKDAKAFVSFSNAMATYKSGPGVLDTISSWASKNIFGEEGPVERFRKFSQMDFGSNPTEVTSNIQKYASNLQTEAGNSSDGSTSSPSFSKTVQSAVSTGASVGAGVVGAVGSTVSAAAGKIYDLGSSAWSAITGGSGKEQKVKPDVLGRKASLEKIMGTKLVVTSGFRAGAANHGDGSAIDLGFNSNPTLKNSDDARNKLMANAINLGFTGIGAEYRAPGGAHIHLDTSHSRLTGWGSDYRSASIGKDSPWLASYLAKIRGGNPKAEGGGVFVPPENQQPISEILAPLDRNSILMKIAKTPADKPTDTADRKTSKSSTSQATKTGGHIDNKAKQNLELYGYITTKLDNMISVLESSNDSHGQRLKYSMV